MSQLNFSKATTGQTLNFAKDFGAGNISKGKISFNLNWGKINGQSVDLDAILVTRSSAGAETKKPSFVGKLFGKKEETSGAKIIETIYFSKTRGTGILHHGDDTTGAWSEGEFIEVDLDALDPKVDELVFSVISYSGQSFSRLPFASFKAFSGTPKNPGQGLVEYELTSFSSGVKAVVMAVVKKNSIGEWEVTLVKETGTSGTVEAAKKLSLKV